MSSVQLPTWTNSVRNRSMVNDLDTPDRGPFTTPVRNAAACLQLGEVSARLGDMTTYGYARVSTRTQDVAGQVEQLHAAGVDVVRAETGSGAGRRPVLGGRGVGLRALHGGIDTTDPVAGKIVLYVMAALAEAERALIVERTRAGLAAARAAGRRGGRPGVMTPERLRVARDENRRRRHDRRGRAHHRRLPAHPLPARHSRLGASERRSQPRTHPKAR